MGISGLTKLLHTNASKAISYGDLSKYKGRRIALDATQNLYQFLIAMPSTGNTRTLIDGHGNTTSHLHGLFSRTTRLVDCGIKPIFIFDGETPELKANEVQKRTEAKMLAEAGKREALERGDDEAAAKFGKRAFEVQEKHVQEAQKLLQLMGMPVILAPGEAEAQCAAMVKAGKAFATGTEDMDALTFGTPILLRHLYADQKKGSIKEFNLRLALKELNLNYNQVRNSGSFAQHLGIGPVKALDFMTKHGSIEEVVKNLDHSKFIVPDIFNYEPVRELFKKPLIMEPSKISLKWTEPQEKPLMAFLCREKAFKADVVISGIARLREGLKIPELSQTKKSTTVVTKQTIILSKATQAAEESQNKASPPAKIAPAKTTETPKVAPAAKVAPKLSESDKADTKPKEAPAKPTQPKVTPTAPKATPPSKPKATDESEKPKTVPSSTSEAPAKPAQPKVTPTAPKQQIPPKPKTEEEEKSKPVAKVVPKPSETPKSPTSAPAPKVAPKVAPADAEKPKTVPAPKVAPKTAPAEPEKPKTVPTPKVAPKTTPTETEKPKTTGETEKSKTVPAPKTTETESVKPAPSKPAPPQRAPPGSKQVPVKPQAPKPQEEEEEDLTNKSWEEAVKELLKKKNYPPPK